MVSLDRHSNRNWGHCEDGGGNRGYHSRVVEGTGNMDDSAGSMVRRADPGEP